MRILIFLVETWSLIKYFIAIRQVSVLKKNIMLSTDLKSDSFLCLFVINIEAV